MGASSRGPAWRRRGCFWGARLARPYRWSRGGAQPGVWSLVSVSHGNVRAPPRGCCDRHHERPTMLRKAVLLIAVLAANPTAALAQPPLPLPFPPLPMPQGTPEERAACAPDVHKYCEAALPDTMRVLACLQANRGKISRACNQVLVSHGQ